MPLYCPECGSADHEKTGQRHHAYEWRCCDCGHTFYWG